MADTLAERVLEELNLQDFHNRGREESLLLAVTPYPSARVYQIQVAEKQTLPEADEAFGHYVREIITLPMQAQANVVDYLIQPKRLGHTHTSRKGQNHHALAVTAFYDFDPSFLHPIGERWRNAVRRPNVAGYEVRAAFDTIEGVKYTVLNFPVRKEGEEERILEATSSVLRKREGKWYLKDSGQFAADLSKALKTPLSGMKLSTLTTGEMRSTLEGLSCLSVYADVREVSDHREIYPSSGMLKKAFSGGRVEFSHVVFKNALQKVVGAGPSKELQLLRSHCTYVLTGRADAREKSGVLYCA